MTGSLTVHSGAVRGSDVRIEMSAPDYVGGTDTIVAVASGPGGTTELVVRPFHRPTPLRPDHLVVRLPLERFPTPLGSIILERRSGDVVVPASTESDFELDRLFPGDEREFAATFTWEGQRIRDAETLRFASAQVVRHSGFPAARIAAAASIVAYRSLDLGDEPWLREALRMIDEAIGRIDELEHTGDARKPANVRTDRTHLSISLCTIRWHLCLHLGMFDEVLASLELGLDHLRPIVEAWSVGYNGSKIVLLLGYLLWRAGDVDRAIEVWDFAFVLYQRVAASASNDNPTLFNDHRTSHRVAFLGMVGKFNALGRPTPRGMVLDAKTVCSEVFRVRDREALARLAARMDELVAWAESSRPEA